MAAIGRPMSVLRDGTRLAGSTVVSADAIVNAVGSSRCQLAARMSIPPWPVSCASRKYRRPRTYVANAN